MRQTYAKEYTRAHEIAALVAEVKRRQLQLDHKLAPLLLPIIEGILSGLSGAAIGYGFAKISDERLLQNAARWLKDYEADSRQGSVSRDTRKGWAYTRTEISGKTQWPRARIADFDR
ncbi:hypothetical protein [Kordiimonas sp.]|uniref:hypothetical protein n=1 Tax=Kordiimonas sp. TaxID=1970157 RepID=UPI003A91C155